MASTGIMQRLAVVSTLVASSITFGQKYILDSDRDGIPDRVDRCPETPVGTDVALSGCSLLQECEGTDGVASILCLIEQTFAWRQDNRLSDAEFMSMILDIAALASEGPLIGPTAVNPNMLETLVPVSSGSTTIVDTDQLTPVSDIVMVDTTGVTFNRRDNTLRASVTVTNISGDDLPDELFLVIRDLPGGVSLLAPDAMTADGNEPGVYLGAENADGMTGLQPGESTTTRQLRFVNPDLTQFDFDTDVWEAGLRIDLDGPLTVTLGSTLILQLTARGQETDEFMFGANPLPLPAGATLDPMTGLFRFRPNVMQIGEFDIAFTLSEGEQSVQRPTTITVQESPPGTATALRGRVVDTNAYVAPNGSLVPIENAVVTLLGTGISAMTDADGFFTLSGIPDGNQIFDIDPTNALPAPDGSDYAGFREKLEIVGGTLNDIDRPFFLPRIDASSVTPVDPSTTTTVENPGLGIALTVLPNTAEDQNGSLFTGNLSISEVPEALAPAALPANLNPGLLITVQPVGVRFRTPAPVTFPNVDGLSPGSETDLWSLDPEEGVFTVVGVLRVSDDGSVLETISGGIIAADWHAALPPSPSDDMSDENNENDEDGKGVNSGSRTTLRKGNLSVSHSLVPYRSAGAERSLLFQYNSTTADPQPIVASNSTIVVRAAVPNTISMRLSVGGVQQPGEPFTGTGGLSESIDEDVRTAVQFDGLPFRTGLYPYQLRLSSNYGFSSVSALRAGALLVNNERDSPYGAGWTIAGLERLYLRDGVPQAVLADGRGRVKVFVPQNAATRSFTDLAFVVDGSGSISSQNWNLQREGIAQAIENASIIPQDGSVAVCFLQFAGSSAVVHVPLTTIGSSDDASAVATQVRSIGQRNGGTPLAAGVNAAVPQLVPGRPLARKVICVSTDGAPNSAAASLMAAENAIASGIDEIDALAVGPGADVNFLEGFVRNGFVVTVASFQQFRDAISQKIREVIAGSPAGDFTQLSRNDDGTFVRRLADGATQLFDDEGMLIQHATREGQATTYSYNSDGTLSQVTDVAGLVTQLSYVDGTLSTVTDPLGRVTSFTHDGNGCLVQIVGPDGQARRFTYDDRCRMRSQVTRAGFTTSYDYDFAGRHCRSTLPDGSVRTVRSSRVTGLPDTSQGFGTPLAPSPFVRPEDNVAEFVDANGNRSVYRLDRFGRPTEITDALGRTVKVTTNADGLVERLEFPNGRIDEMEYDDRGNLVELREAAGSTLERVATYAYENQFNQLIEAIDFSGNRTVIEYDDLGRSVRAIDPAGQERSRTYLPNTDLVATEVDENGGVTSFEYDPLGRETNRIDGAGYETRFEYDSAGNIITIRRGVGSGDERTIRRTFDVENRVRSITDSAGATTDFEYDSDGNLIRTTDPTGAEVVRGFDGRGRLTSVAHPLRGVYSFEYDAEGNAVLKTDPNGSETRYQYNGVGRLQSSMDPNGFSRSMTYDSMGYLTSITDGSGSVTSYAYDLLGRLTQRTDPLGAQDQYAYDSSDNLTRHTTRRGDVITHSYDTLGRRTRVTAPDNTTTFVYDPNSNILQVVDDDSAIHMEYDAIDRIVAAETVGGLPAGQPALRVEYVYNATGERTGMSDDMGGDVQYGRDAAGRLASLSGLTPTTQFGFSYDSAGRLQQIAYPNGVNSVFQYDQSSGLLTTLSYTNVDTMAFQYDPAGNVSAIIETLRSRGFEYDAGEQLVGITDSAQINSPTLPLSGSYVYDAAGNRVTDLSGNNLLYDAANRLTQDGQFDYQYDNAGNRVSRTDRSTGEQTGYQWDTEGRLVNIVEPDGTNTPIAYDGLGRRIRSGTSVFVYDIDDVILEWEAGSLVSRYLHGPLADQLLSVLDEFGNVVYVHQDHQRSVVATTDGAGVVTGRAMYSAFGAEVENATGLRYGYTGREHAPGGLLYYRNRYYDPATGAFISEDPAEFFFDEHLYRYVENDPVNSTDPNGLGKIKVLIETVKGIKKWVWKNKDDVVKDLKNGKNVDFVGKGANKNAKDAAEKAWGEVVKHPPHGGKSKYPHYQPKKRRGRKGHANVRNNGFVPLVIPGACLGQDLFGDNLLGEAANFFNPLGDIQDVIDLVNDLVGGPSEYDADPI